METPNTEKKSNKLWPILLAVSVLINLYQWRTSTSTIESKDMKIDTLYVEIGNIDKELTDTKEDLEKYRGISANLDSLLNEANVKIEDQVKSINELRKKNNKSKAEIEKLNQQLKNLEELRDEYLSRIDQLLQENQQLKNDNQNLTTNLQKTSKELESTVATASVLKAENFTVTSYKRRDSGKYIQMSIAKRVHKMDVCFDILDNKIAKAGSRNVYLRITEPGGKPIGNRSTGSGSFKSTSGEEIMYAATTTVDYKGAKMNKVCLSYEEKDDKQFAVGTYMIEVYIDGVLAGAASTVLR